MRTLLLIVGASLLAGSWPGAPAAAAQAPTQLEELVVTGDRAGPGLWHVHRGAAQMWVLGSLSPLPKGITWRATEVERVLASTDRVLVPKPLEIGIVRILWLLVTERSLIMVRGGKRLRDVLPPDLRARFALDRSKYTSDADKWEHFRPIVAAAFLQQAAFRQVGLSARIDLGAAVRSLAKKHDVRVEEVKIAGVGEVLEALKSMSPATENTCVQASLATVEKDLPRLMERARLVDRQRRAYREPAGAGRGVRLPRGPRFRRRRGRPRGPRAQRMVGIDGEVFAGRWHDARGGQHGPAARARRIARLAPSPGIRGRGALAAAAKRSGARCCRAPPGRH